MFRSSFQSCVLISVQLVFVHVYIGVIVVTRVTVFRRYKTAVEGGVLRRSNGVVVWVGKRIAVDGGAVRCTGGLMSRVAVSRGVDRVLCRSPTVRELKVPRCG